MLNTPDVTVIVLNFNGREHLGPCLESLDALDYPSERLHVRVVDNASVDDSLAFLARSHPTVPVIRNDRNLGFSAAMNRAVEAAETPFIALLNNDARVDAAWLRELIAPVAADDADCAGSRLVSWDGSQTLFEGGGCNFHGIGFQCGMDAPEGATDSPEILFACGAALAMRRERFLEAGGFDEDYFAYYEDVDFGWRLWLLGHRVVLAPRSIVYHQHSATASRVPVHKLRVLHVRNPIWTILKNYEHSSLGRTLPAALLLSLARTSYLANVDVADYRIADEAPAPAPKRRWWRRAADASKTTVPKVALSDIVAYRDVTMLLDHFLAKRAALQARRRRSDAEIAPLFRDPLWHAESSDEYRRLQATLVDFFGVTDAFADPAAGR